MPSTRSIGDGSGHTPMAATASTRIACGPVASPANVASRASASAEPTLRFALMTRRRSGSLANRFSASRPASAGNAPSIEPSSLMARAASRTIASSLSVTNRATSGLRRRRSATTAAMRTPREGCVDSAPSADVSPIRERARLPACRRYTSLSSLAASIATICGAAGL